MLMGSLETLLARAMFARSIKVSGWQPGTPKSREHNFPKKHHNFMKFNGPVTPLWVLYPPKIMLLGSTEPLLATSNFTRSIKVLGWQSGAPKVPAARFSEKNVLIF